MSFFLLSLLLVVQLYVAQPTPLLSLTVLPSSFASSFGAACLDGTAPAFYALEQDPKRWILFIEGGGWCFSLADCAGRAKGGGGSSSGMAPSMNVGGLLSPNSTINPRFSNYSFVFIHYCDGSSHSSNNSAPLVVGNQTIYLRGRPNLVAVITYLLSTRGMVGAEEIILSGGSAGGTSAFLAMDAVAEMLPPSVRFVGAPDAGFFINAPIYTDPSDYAFQNEFISADATFWHSTATGNLNDRCLAVYAAEPWRCFFPENSAPYIKTPFHAMMSSYDLASLSLILGLPCLPPKCDTAQLTSLLAWRDTFLAYLVPAIQSYPGNGCYIDSCLVHEQNVDYCSGQSVPNCRGWNIYNVTAPSLPPALTPQAGFTLYYDSLMEEWDAIKRAREDWTSLIDVAIKNGERYPDNATRQAFLEDPRISALKIIAASSNIMVIDPLVWPENPSCPWGTT
jgi:hypothetical protein